MDYWNNATHTQNELIKQSFVAKKGEGKWRKVRQNKVKWGKIRPEQGTGREKTCNTQSSNILLAMYNILQSKTDWDGSYFAWSSGDG